MRNRRQNVTHDRLRECLHYDPLTGIWHWRIDIARNVKAGNVAGHKTKTYTTIRIDRQEYCSHVLAWFYMTGKWPNDEVDHENTIKDDDRWENLREATRQQNSWNANPRRNNKSGYKGVRYHHGRWVAQIWNRTSIHIGNFDTPEEASDAYIREANRIFGDFARF